MFKELSHFQWTFNPSVNRVALQGRSYRKSYDFQVRMSLPLVGITAVRIELDTCFMCHSNKVEFHVPPAAPNPRLTSKLTIND